MIEISADLVGLWALQTIPNRQDWMCGVTDLHDGSFKIAYRLRYYSPVGDGNPFNDEDHKSWYEAIVPGPREEVVAKMRLVGQELARQARSTLHEVLMVDGDLDRFQREMSKIASFHFAKVPVNPEHPGEWRCRCGHLNGLIVSTCTNCGATIDQTYGAARHQQNGPKDPHPAKGPKRGP